MKIGPHLFLIATVATLLASGARLIAAPQSSSRPSGSTPDSLTLTSSANPATFGQPVKYEATISAADATGKVTFYDGVTVLGIRMVANGKAALSISPWATGSRSIQAYYSGDAHYSASRSKAMSQSVSVVPSGGFANGGISGYGAFPISVAVADFNGDGKADFAITVYCSLMAYRFCTYGDSTVKVILGNGDGTFEPIVPYQTGGQPSAVVTGDFNGDGIPDLAVNAGPGISVLLGVGDGTFQPAVNYPVGTGSRLLAGDLNGDGIVDLVVGGATSVSVLLGKGDASFQTPRIYPVANQVTDVALADFNADGNADVVVCNGQTVSVLLGNNDGTLRGSLDSVVGATLTSVAVGDLNGDGKVDLAVGVDGGFSVLLGNGDGMFQPPVQYDVKNPSPAGPRLVNATAIAVADFDGDGKADLAVVTADPTTYIPYDPTRGFATLFLGNGDGTFQSQRVYNFNNTNFVAVTDFNGDGRPDLAGLGGALLGLEQTATTLTSSLNPSIYGQLVTLTASLSPAVATGSVTFYDGTAALGSVAVAGGQAIFTSGSLTPGSHALTASYGGDRTHAPSVSAVLTQMVNVIPEVITLTSSQAPTSTYGQNVILTAVVSPIDTSGTVTFQDGSTTLGTRTVIGGQAQLSITTLAVGSHSLQATYSGDATHAAAASSSVSQSVTQGTVTTPETKLTSSATVAIFGQPVTLTATIAPAASGKVTFYDGMMVLGTRNVVNGQASLTDSLLAAGSRPLRAYYSGDSHYTASTSSVLTLTVNVRPSTGFQLAANAGGVSTAIPTDFALADFNEDGKSDLAVAVPAVAGGFTVSMLLGNGDGTFRSGMTYPMDGTSTSLAAGDFNGDGHTDLAVSNGIDVSVLLGRGDGTFQPAVHYSTGVVPNGLVLGDFNNDGQADLAVGNQDGVSVLLGKGDGTFQSAIHASDIAGTRLTVGDFNGDGTADLVVIDSQSVRVSVVLGYGDGTFRTTAQYVHPSPSAYFSATGVVIGDFNGDGKADLAMALSYGSASVSMYLGKGDGTFQSEQSMPLTGISTGRMVAGDFNGDGKTDLIAGVSHSFAPNSFFANGITVLFGNGDGTFPTIAEYDLDGYLTNPLVVGDFNQDGVADLANFTGTGISALLGASGAFPSVNAGGVVNAATMTPGPVAAGSIASAFGSYGSLGGISIRVSATSAPLFSASPGQVNFQVPWRLGGPTTISAVANGKLSVDQTLNITSFAPGIFAMNFRGTGQGAILDSAYRLMDAANPAAAGSSIVQIYCTGLGVVSNQPATGSPALSEPLSTTLTSPSVTIGGASAEVMFSGLTPGAVGLYQVNVLVPADSAKGPAVPVAISIQGTTSNTVTMAVQ